MHGLRSIMITNKSLIVRQFNVPLLGKIYFIVVDHYPFKGLLQRYRIKIHKGGL